jgi:hypothetical protein
VTGASFAHDGQRYLSLEVVAELYHLDTVVLREVYDRGLLGAGLDRGATVWIASVRLDRVATVVRLHHACGLDVDSIAALLPRG